MATGVARCIAAMMVIGAVLFGSTNESAAGQTKPPKQDYNSGAYLYRTFCASCHGESGHGDGPAAATLTTPLADLTKIAARAGGSFPRDQVTRMVDGRTALPGHHAEMPKWGQVLRSVEGDSDRVIQQRIDALVKHLEAIQRP